MSDSENNESTGGFAWFLAGLGIGALVGVLYAPKAGKDTRDELVASALDAKEKASKMYAEKTEQVGEYVRQGKQTANEYVDKSKQFANDYVDKGKQFANDYVDKGKEYLRQGPLAVDRICR